MFESLSDRLGGVFDRLTRQGALTEADVQTALREVRTALLEADVSLPVARDFVKAVERKATGQAVTKSITPGQQVVKIVHDELVNVLGGEDDAGSLKIDSPPAPILMVGLQGGGKTTTTAKLAKRLKEREGKKVLMASLDTNRPAAMEQLAILGTQIGVDTLPIVPGEDPVAIARRAEDAGLPGRLRRLHARHRRAAPHRRGADPAGGRGARRGAPARDAARGGRPDGSGRRGGRQGVRRQDRRLGRGAHADGRRRARGRGAVDARRDRQAHPLRRPGREARRAGDLRSRSGSPAASWAWATSSPSWSGRSRPSRPSRPSA